MEKQMKAIRFYEPGVIKFEEIDTPQISENEVLIKTKAILTCGTDLKVYRRGHPKIKPPMIFGHEFSGIVAQVGSKVTKFVKGMRVVAANSAPCNECFYCKRKKQNLCENLLQTLIGFSIDGAYAEYVRIPERIVRQNMYEIPDHVSFQEAAFTEPLACVVNGNEIADINLTDNVVVIGAGPIGLLHIQLARARGAKNVIAIDLIEYRLQKALEVGAHTAINANKDPVEKVKKITNGRGADVVIECVGLPQTWENAIAMTGKAGTTILFGGAPPGTKISVDTHRMHYEDLTIKGVFHHTPICVKRALDLISSGIVNVKPLITKEMPLNQVETALQEMQKGETIKIAMIP
ncbi:MAG: zinc-binding dehydrogenase [Promethearchaeota archaeon]